MKLKTHVENSIKNCGVSGEDIHAWIDAHFDHENFNEFVHTGILPKEWNPYEHRIHRHCIEALAECLVEFTEKYTEDDIKSVFESHLLDDYRGYLPSRDDFLDKNFHDKYHLF